MSKFWRCSNCGAILKKKHPQETIDKIKAAGKKITGTSTCGKCRTSFAQAEVYDGLYDLDPRELTEIARKKKAEKEATAIKEKAEAAAAQPKDEEAASSTQQPAADEAQPPSQPARIVPAGEAKSESARIEPLKPAESQPIAPSKPVTPPPSPAQAQPIAPAPQAEPEPEPAPEPQPIAPAPVSAEPSEFDSLGDDDMPDDAPGDAFRDSGVHTGMFEPPAPSSPPPPPPPPAPAAAAPVAEAGALAELDPGEDVGELNEISMLGTLPDDAEARPGSFREFRPALSAGVICCDVCARQLESRGGYMLAKQEIIDSPDYIELVLERWQLNGYLPRGAVTDQWRDAAKQDIDSQAGTEPWLVCDDCIILFPAVRAEALETAAQRAAQWWPSSNLRATVRFTGRTAMGSDLVGATESPDPLEDTDPYNLPEPRDDYEDDDDYDDDESMQTYAAPPGEIAVSHMNDNPDDEDPADGLLLDDEDEDEDDDDAAMQTMLNEPEPIAVSRYDDDDDVDLDLDDDEDPFTEVDPLDEDD